MTFPFVRRFGRSLRFVALALVLAGGSRAALDREYYTTLYTLCDALVATQITQPDAADFGALVCPSVNPQEHPLHPRAGEAVYPLAIAFRETHEAKYRDAAIRVANWMITKQQPNGAWGEEWPNYDGWTGTTSDQVISLAGAYPILRDKLSESQRATWLQAITAAANYIEKTFPMGNMNYQPTGAVALEMAAEVITDPPGRWRAKADALLKLTLDSINADNFVTGEGNGVDLGYNIAQTIGYLTLYGKLTANESLRARAATLLRTHATFVYPNGTIDNSWGTRSFKWVYESGTKTAPGVYFTFALLADQDPAFAVQGRRCLDYLTRRALANGLVQYGPAAHEHASTEPPCLYSTFARAQSIAMAIAYAPEPIKSRNTSERSEPPGVELKFFPLEKVAVVHTPKLMATVSAYGAIKRYGRQLVSRGGSITNLWLEGFGPEGMAQASSVNIYRREERAHMPNEEHLLPLTPRIETTLDGTWYTNLFDDSASMTAAKQGDSVVVTTSGELTAESGKKCGVHFVLTHRFFVDRWENEYRVESATPVEVKIVEPFVNSPEFRVARENDRRFVLSPGGNHSWSFELSGDSSGTLKLGAEPQRYWCPFPAVECLPIETEISTAQGSATATVSFRPILAPSGSANR